MDELADWLRDAPTLHAAARRREGVHRMEGRGEVWDVPAPGAHGRWIVRRYRRGGALAGVLGESYPRSGTPRPLAEIAATEGARRRGVSAPRVIAGAMYPAGPLFYRADLVTEKVEGARDVAAIVFGRGGFGAAPHERGAPGEREAALRAAAVMARRLGRAGVWHRDLNLKNVLVRGGDAWVLDLDRARLLDGASEAATASMLRRLRRSLEKWERRTRVTLTAAERAAVAPGGAEASSSR